MTSVFVDPSVVGPDLLFSTGTVVDGVEQFDPTLPDLGGSADAGWNITQWNTPAAQIFNPATPILADAADRDPVLGAALASWHTGTVASGSGLVVYGRPGSITDRLIASGGNTRDTFLQTTGYAPGTTTFDRQMTYTANERLVTAQASGGGTAIGFNAFTVFFNWGGTASYTSSLPSDELFLQVPLFDFRGEPTPFQTISRNNDNGAMYNLSSWTGGASDASMNYLGFAADTGPLHTVTIDLTQALVRMVDAMAAQDPAHAAAFLDLSRWSLGSVYAGVETSANGGSASAALDIAHPVVTQAAATPVSSAVALSTVQSIDANRYAALESAATVTTLPGTTNSITLTGTGQKTVTSRGTDSVSIGDRQSVTLHARGASLAVTGHQTSYGSATVDGSARIALGGSFGSLIVVSNAAGDRIAGSAGSAQLTLGGAGAVVQMTSTVTASLSGANAVLAANGGTVGLHAGGARIDLDGNASQTITLGGQDAAITETGTGNQTIRGDAAQAGHVVLSGGHGIQTFWTGGTRATITGSSDRNGALTLHAQAGSTSTVQLGVERTTIDAEGGGVTILGSAAGGTATVQGGAGAITIWGGAETLAASDGNGASGSMQVQAGSGSQTIFGGREMLTVMGSHAVAGSQTIVNGSDAACATMVFGGRTSQTVWTGQATDTLVASTQAGDASGRIDAFIQGGTSRYWGGTEQASLDNQGGILDAYLAGTGAVSILADMTHNTTTMLNGYTRGTDTLTLGGVADPASVHVTSAGGNLMLSAGGSGATVTLFGTTHVTLSHGADGVLVTG